MRPSEPHVAKAWQYAQDVLDETVLACKWTRLACERFFADLDREWQFEPDWARAEKAMRFLELLPHVKGAWAGSPTTLEPWQCFIFANLYGWVHKETRLRRFRRAFIFVPRKNGKTHIAAGTGLLMLTEEAEPGAEVYCGATSEVQANEVFRPAKAMANRAEGFRKHYGVTVAASSIYREDGLSFFQRLIGKPGEGQSPYCAIHDEYHEHKTPEQVDSMDTGMGARQEPLQLIITTAGTDPSSPCKELDDYARKVLEGTLRDDRLFALIYCADRDDDWQDFDTWRKANPNIGVSVSEEYLRDKLEEAKQRVSVQNTRRCKHLNEWMNAGEAWIDLTMWNKLADQSLRLEDMHGEKCWMGLDLASKIDMCALIMLFRPDDRWVLFGKYYLPSETINRVENDHYRRWVKEGWLTETEGARTDFRVIEEDIKALREVVEIQELDFDPRESGYLIANIQEWADFNCVEVPQGPAQMSEPMKEMEAIIHAGQITHNGDPVFAWMLSNVVQKRAKGSGPVKYYYPTKERNDAKIDGPVAAIMALKAGMSGRGLETSVYETRGVLTFGRVGE